MQGKEILFLKVVSLDKKCFVFLTKEVCLFKVTWAQLFRTNDIVKFSNILQAKPLPFMLKKFEELLQFKSSQFSIKNICTLISCVLEGLRNH